jgi:hypothetical protein
VRAGLDQLAGVGARTGRRRRAGRADGSGCPRRGERGDAVVGRGGGAVGADAQTAAAALGDALVEVGVVVVEVRERGEIGIGDV